MKNLNLLTKKENKLLDDYIYAQGMSEIAHFNTDILDILVKLEELKDTDVGSKIYREYGFDRIERCLSSCKKDIGSAEVNDLEYFYKLKEKLMMNWKWTHERHGVCINIIIKFERVNREESTKPVVPLFFDEHRLNEDEIEEHNQVSDDIWGLFIRKLIKMKIGGRKK